MNHKRIIVCLAGGIISAIICITAGILRGAITGFSIMLLSSILNRILIGFVIGISGWKINFIIHGAAIGLMVSLINSVKFIPDDMLSFILYSLAGVIYGTLIEFFATKIFKVQMET